MILKRSGLWIAAIVLLFGLATSMTLLLFRNKEAAIKFLHYLNRRYNNIQFTVDFENNQEIPFLDVSVKVPINIHLTQENFYWTLY